MHRKNKADRAARRAAKEERRRNRTKGQKIRDRAMNVIMFCLIGIIAVSGFNVGKSVYNYWKARHAYNQISKEAKVDPDQFTGVVDFDALRKENPDVQAWLYQKDTVINYPVVQGEDNDTYLHTGFNRKPSGSGTLFVDYRCPANFKGFNTIIYGHHMYDGSMFRSLRGYTKTSGYYDKHKTLELITPSGKYHLVVFASYITPATGDAYTYEFASDEEKQSFIDNAFKRSKIDVSKNDVPVTTKDRMVTLSTCAYDYDEARYVVICKMVPWTSKEIAAGEELQAKIDRQSK